MALNIKFILCVFGVVGQSCSVTTNTGGEKGTLVEYIRDLERPPLIAAALHAGKVVPGMSVEDAYWASGIKTKKYRDYIYLFFEVAKYIYLLSLRYTGLIG
jgi:hypothetical protein